ncbi:MAG: cytochrome b/b6 domain-containing protein [Bacilli bacterium]|nr:cytochrome b/b6 domain-containing protein [Bacilli bacterium]
MKYKKIVLDIVMTILFIILLDTNISGILYHEIIGIIVFGLFIMHKLFNIKWIKAISKNIFSNKVNIKTKIMYILNLLILISTIMILISGVLISQKLFVIFNASNLAVWSTIHHYSSYICLGLIIIHILFHLNIIKKELISNKKVSIITFIISILGLSTLLYSNNVKNNLNNKVDNTIINESIDSTNNDDVIIDSKDVDSNNIKDTTGDIPSLDEYLSNLNCNGCGNNCALNNIKCGRGNEYVDSATTDYYNLYPTVSSN